MNKTLAIRLITMWLRIGGLVLAVYAYVDFCGDVCSREDIATSSLTPVFGLRVLLAFVMIAGGGVIDSMVGVITEYWNRRRK